MKLYLDDIHYINTDEPIDISIPLSDSAKNPKAWYVDQPKFEPVRTENYVGSIKEGGNVNFRNIQFNPHGHGTHTECLGHITPEIYSVNYTLKNFFFRASLRTIKPDQKMNEDGELDFIITREQLDLKDIKSEALIIRTLPNTQDKRSMNYSSKNPTYLDVLCAKKIYQAGIQHFLIDLPSVDRENDNGELAFHHAFWEVPENPNHERTITEFIFVDNSILDGEYILNIQMAPFENDASPSRPVLYKLKER
jgi:kynurenine formamidase